MTPIQQTTPLTPGALPGQAAAGDAATESSFGQILGLQLAAGDGSGLLLPGELAALSKSLTRGDARDEALPAADASNSQAVLPNDMLALLLPQQLTPQDATLPQQAEAAVTADVLQARRPETLLPGGKPAAAITAEPQLKGDSVAAKEPSAFMAALSAAPATAETSLPEALAKPAEISGMKPADPALSVQPSLAMATPASSQPAPAQVTVQTPVAHANWGDEFGQKVTWLVSQKEQGAELHLNPAQLGPVDVTLKLNGDQASIHFTSPHAAVREAIEQAIPRLRDMLQESGITLGNANVSDQSAQQGQAERQPGARLVADHANLSGDALAPEIPAPRVSTIQRHNGIVDTFV